MKTVLLIGLGHFGAKVAYELYNLNCEVLGVDIEEEKVENSLKFLDDGRIGDCSNKDFLKSIGVDNFDVVINAIGGNFKASLETTLMLRESGAKFIVARADDDVHEDLLKKVGADKVLNAEQSMASWTAIRFGTNHVLDFINIDSDNAVFELEVPKNWIGKTVVEIDIRKKYGINIIAVRKTGKIDSNILPTTAFGNDDSIFVIGNKSTIEKKFNVISK